MILNIAIFFIYGLLTGAIMWDVKKRHGTEVFWIATAILAFLSIGAAIVYKDILFGI